MNRLNVSVMSSRALSPLCKICGFVDHLPLNSKLGVLLSKILVTMSIMSTTST